MKALVSASGLTCANRASRGLSTCEITTKHPSAQSMVNHGCNTRDVDVMMYCHLFGSDSPIGAQGVTICVRPFGSSLSRAVNLHLSRSESTQRALRRHSESTQNQSHTIGA